MWRRCDSAPQKLPGQMTASVIFGHLLVEQDHIRSKLRKPRFQIITFAMLFLQRLSSSIFTRQFSILNSPSSILNPLPPSTRSSRLQEAELCSSEIH
jgi:hypothetical protein